MIERKFIPLVVAVFVLTAGLSGSATVAVLSDSETVNVQISPDNVTASVVDNATPTPTPNEPEKLTVDDVDGLIVELEPADKTTNPGKTAKYDVVVTGATEGITGYHLDLELSNSSVASFDSFEHEHELTSQNQTVTDDGVAVDAGAGINETIWGVESENTTVTKLGQVTVNGTASGQTELAIKDTGIVGTINGTDQNYQIGVVNGSELVVTDE
jgi:predicted ribosomally synthesized peptide with SipW-like signal peptide